MTQRENFGSIRESSLGCMQGVLLRMKKLHFISQNWHKENSTVACRFRPIKIHHSDYPKRINEVDVFFQ